MKNHEGINYVHFPDGGFAIMLNGDKIEMVREITDEGGNMLSCVDADSKPFSLKFTRVYTPLGKPSIPVPKISTFIGNNKLFTYNGDKSYVKGGSTFKILDCTTLEVLYTSPKIIDLNVTEEIIEFNGQILDTSTMKFIDVNPRDTYTLTTVGEQRIAITKYEGSLIELPYFNYLINKAPYIVIYENYIIAIGRTWLTENEKCVNYKLIKVFDNTIWNFVLWRIESIKKPKAALKNDL